MSPSLQVHPARERFDRLAAEWPLAPVWAEVLADVSTPVGLFPAIAGDGPGVLFESVERSERWGRYSFVAGDPAAVLIADDAGVHLRDVVRELPTGEPSRRLTPREAQAMLRGLKGLNVVGGDVVEVAPQYDAATTTAIVQARQRRGMQPPLG